MLGLFVPGGNRMRGFTGQARQGRGMPGRARVRQSVLLRSARWTRGRNGAGKERDRTLHSQDCVTGAHRMCRSMSVEIRYDD